MEHMHVAVTCRRYKRACGACRVVLVGDPQQLPATILSKQSRNLAFDRSLFERLMQAGWPVKMLSVQYRMHPHIRRFPSNHFYHGNLQVLSSPPPSPPKPLLLCSLQY